MISRTNNPATSRLVYSDELIPSRIQVSSHRLDSRICASIFQQIARAYPHLKTPTALKIPLFTRYGLSQKCIFLPGTGIAIHLNPKTKLGEGNFKSFCKVVFFDVTTLKIKEYAMALEKYSQSNTLFLKPSIQSRLKHLNFGSLKNQFALKNPKGYQRGFFQKSCLSNFQEPLNLTEPIFYKFALNMVAGLNKLHENGFIHGDLNPGNFAIFPSKSGIRAKVIDLDSLKKIPTGNYKINQSLFFLAPQHRWTLLKTYERYGLLTSDLVITYNSIDSKIRNFDTTIENEIASMGLVLSFYYFSNAHILSKLSAKVSFLELISNLTGGFSPKESDLDFYDFNERLDRELRCLHNYTKPSVDLIDAIELFMNILEII